MINKKSGIYILLAITIATFFAAIAIVSNCQGNSNNEISEPNQTAPPEKKEPPIIIWFHNGVYDTPEALNTAVSSGLVTHAMIKYMHRADANWKTKPVVIQAIKAARDSKAELVWCRNLWPYYNNAGVTENSIFDPNYYIREIQILRAEAKEMGAKYTAFDLESYGESPLQKHTRALELSSEQYKRVSQAINKAIETVGKVDFTLPSGSNRTRHPYNSLAKLGKYRINEHTYYDNMSRIKGVKYPYEIFGAYINTTKTNERHSYNPFYLAGEIFEKSERWSNKKGLFLYPRERKALEVAKDLLEYSKSLPVKEAPTNNSSNNK